MNDDLLISIVAPVFNEEEGIKEYIDRTLATIKPCFTNYELVLVDDGSKDRTVSVIQAIQQQEKNIRVIRLSRNYGREIAMTAGLESAIGDIVVLMDADLQDPPELIPQLVKKMQEGYDIVYAARTNRIDESWFKKISSKLFYRLSSELTGFSIPEDAGDFRAMNRKVINSLVKMKEKVRYMKMLYAYVGFKIASVPFERQGRFKGTTKYNYFKLIDAALDAIVSFSDKPLRLVAVFSLIISFLMFVLSFKGLIDKFVVKNIESGWASLFFVMTMMFSILFIFLAIFAEYISRILIETKDRPLYYIAEELNSSVIKNNLNIVEDL